MAEKEKEKEIEVVKKKGSKLPMIAIMVLMLAAGGFFGMKMKLKKSGPPPITLSKGKPVKLKQFLVNLQDHDVYCRADIALGLSSTADAAEIKNEDPAIRDAINMRLMSKTLADLSTVSGLKFLKKQLASDINKVINEASGKKPPVKPAPQSKIASPPKPVKPIHPDWDSQTGPVLKIYFDSFATQ